MTTRADEVISPNILCGLHASPAPTDTRSRPLRLLAVLGGLLFALALGVAGHAYLVRFSQVAPAGASIWTPLSYDVALFSTFALHHSLLARTPLKRVIRARVDAGTERTLYVIIASLLFLWCCLAWQPLPGVWYTLPGVAAWLGRALQVAGLVVTAAAVRRLDVLELAGVRVPGAGDAAGERTLETRGLYALVRHPIYLGWVLLVAGAPEMTATRGVFAAISVVYLALAVPFEERSLVRTFGAPYEAYQRTVRWRMIPGLY